MAHLSATRTVLYEHASFCVVSSRGWVCAREGGGRNAGMCMTTPRNVNRVQ